MKTITIELHDGYDTAITFTAIGTASDASGNYLTCIQTVSTNLKDLDGNTIVVNSDGSTEIKENDSI